MKTAEEILDKYYQPNMHWKAVNRNRIIIAINEARAEAIVECAKISRIDKQSILSLINELK